MTSTTQATWIPLRILLAEDNRVNQRIVLTLLNKQGYGADVVSDGQEAIDALMRQSYDVILMDVQMPRMDGLQATATIRCSFATSRQPYIIGVTAGTTEQDRKACLDAGMNDYIAKPFRLAELLAALRRAGSGRVTRCRRRMRGQPLMARAGRD